MKTRPKITIRKSKHTATAKRFATLTPRTNLRVRRLSDMPVRVDPKVIVPLDAPTKMPRGGAKGGKSTEDRASS